MELSGDLLCPQGFRDPVFFPFGLGWLREAHPAGTAELDPTKASPVRLPSYRPPKSPRDQLPLPTHIPSSFHQPQLVPLPP